MLSGLALLSRARVRGAREALLEALHAEEAATLAEQGFDLALATECTTLCGMTYHSCSEKSGTGSELLLSELSSHHLELVREIYVKEAGTYVFIAQNTTSIYLAFRRALLN